MFATAGEGLWNPEDHLHTFYDATLIPYDVYNCRLIFIPIHQPEHYALYAFDMHDKLSRLDPCGIPPQEVKILQKDILKLRMTSPKHFISA